MSVPHIVPLQREAHEAHKARQASYTANAVRQPRIPRDIDPAKLPMIVPPPLEMEEQLRDIGARAKRERELLAAIEKAKAELKDMFKSRRGVILDLACTEFDVKWSDVISDRRTVSIVIPRHTMMWLVKELTGASYPEIGRRFGGRDHTSALNAIRKTEMRMSRDPKFAVRVMTLRRRIEALLPT